MGRARHGLKWPELKLADRQWFSVDGLTWESGLQGDDIQQLQSLYLLLAAMGGTVQDEDGAETPEPALTAA